MIFHSKCSSRHCTKEHIGKVSAPYHFRRSLQAQSYLKSTPIERPRVNLLVLFVSEYTYESCAFRLDWGSGTWSSLFQFIRRDSMVMLRRKERDCWVNCVFLFYIGVCKSFNREQPVIRGKEWVSFYKSRCMYHTHNGIKHAYVDSHIRCEPCTQDEIKTD